MIAFIPVLAFAQHSDTLRDRDPDLDGARKLADEMQEANFHSRSFYLWSRLRIADAGYTETAYLPTDEQSGGLALRVEAPQRIYYTPHRKIVFTADAVPAYNVLSRGDEDDNRVDYFLRGDVHLLFNHLYLDVYTSRADQLRAYVAVNELARARNDETGMAGEFKYSSRTSVQFAARYREETFPDDRFDPDDETPLALLDRTERNGRASFVHKTFPLTALFVSAEASDYGFQNATFKDSARRWFGAGAQYNSGRTRVRVEAGPATLDFNDPTQHDFSGAIGSIRAARLNGRWTYTAGAGRDIAFSIVQNNNYYVVDNLQAGVDYSATRRLTLRAGVVAERHDYDVPLDDGRLRRDTVSFPSVGFEYAISRLRVGIDAGWYERDSTAGGDTDSGIRYVLRLSFVP
ncbi:MAG TPA: outer membrane beta-barrel protein [Thermoanaerobaculia bacterium]|jgi:hypothetical protein